MSAIMNIKRLNKFVQLCKYKWSIPILSILNDKDGIGFNVLARDLQISKDTLNQTLKILTRDGYIERKNSLKTTQGIEIQLTTQGKRIAPSCGYFLNQSSRLRIHKVEALHWNLPIIAVLNEADYKFSDLKKTLNGITSRALTLALKNLLQENLILRRVKTTFPVTVKYSITEKGKRLYKSVNNLYLLLN